MATFSDLIRALSVVHEQQVDALQKEIEDLRLRAEHCNAQPTPIGVRDAHTMARTSECSESIDASRSSQTQKDGESQISRNSKRPRVSFTSTKYESAPSEKSNGVLRPSTSAKYGMAYGYKTRKAVLFPDLEGVQYEEEDMLTRWREDCNCAARPMQQVVESTTFEVAILILIAANSVLMCLETQYNGMVIGYRIGYPHYESIEDSVWSGASDVFARSEECFLVLFTLEILLRVYAFRQKFVFVFWNWMDLSIVLIGWFDWIAPHAFDPKIARLLRLTKVARALRTLRSSKFMNALHFLMASILSSAHILFWSLWVMFIMQCIFSLTACELLVSYFDDVGKPSTDDQKKVFQYIGSFSRTLVTMYEVLIGNWAPPCRVIGENVSEWACMVLLFYRCVCGFAIVNVIGAVFIQQTMKVLSQDTDMMVMERNITERTFKKRLQTLFLLLEMPKDGVVSMQDMRARLVNPEVQLECLHLGIELHDLDDILSLLTTMKTGITVDEFIQAAHSVRKQANTMDIARVLMHSRSIQKQLTDLSKEVRALHTVGLVSNVASSTVEEEVHI